MAGYGLRWHEWREVTILVARGEIDVDAAAELGRRLERLQRNATVYVDVWDVSAIDPLLVWILATARRRAADRGWGFAVLAEPEGVVDKEIEAAGLSEELPIYRTKQEAMAALRHAP